MAIFKKLNLKVEVEKSNRLSISKRIQCCEDAVNIANEFGKLNENAEEVLLLICCDTKNHVNGIFEVSRGSINSSIVHPREIFKRALAVNSASIIIAHNHPSGITDPSKEDVSITKRIRDVGNLIGINLLDHIIVGNAFDEKYTSLKEKGVV